MLRKSVRALAFVSAVSACPPAIAQVNAMDVCYAMAKDNLRNISVSQTSDASLSALYSNYCYADGSVNDSAVNASGSAIVEALPISAAFAGKSSNERFKQFCSQYQTSTAVTSNQYNYANLVFARALDAVNDCVKAAGGNFGLTYKAITASTLVINFTIPGGQSLVINGIKPDNGVICTGHDYSKPGGGVITYDQATHQTLDASVGANAITCTRSATGALGGNQFYPDKAIVVSTNVGPLDIFWQQDAVFPLVTANTIQGRLDSLQSQIKSTNATLQFNLLPKGSIIPWYSSDALPAGWVKCDGSDPAHCPNLVGQFLRGSTSSGGTGGATRALVGQHGSNNRHPDGNGWSLDGGHYMSNDQIYVDTVPPYTNVIYIMKISYS